MSIDLEELLKDLKSLEHVENIVFDVKNNREIEEIASILHNIKEVGNFSAWSNYSNINNGGPSYLILTKEENNTWKIYRSPSRNTSEDYLRAIQDSERLEIKYKKHKRKKLIL